MTTKHYWHAVARVGDVGFKRPYRTWFNGTPIVLFNSARGWAALADRCPHRHVELSKGRVINGEIECPYHGWRFDGAGQCTQVPGLVGPCPKLFVPQLRVTAAEGVLFVSNGVPDAPPYTHPLAGKPAVVRLVRSDTQTTLVDSAENILDATHTHFTHKGLLRGLTAQRALVSVKVTGGDDWVEADYRGEERQNGVVSRLFEQGRVKTIGRYRHPGITELEYWGPKGLTLATTFHLRATAPGQVEGIGFLAGEGRGVLSILKSLAFPLLFRIALEQD
ncbi:MAG: Rieske 2Fe-2S domain-containing protein, partial [Rhodobacteraceae bacterium]|nr:Rieske 2Fe-2S domain-containing protein [Paracoccaceae bacterium]